MGRFHMVYEKIKESLDGMPYEQLGITDEVKEQVGLLVLFLYLFLHLCDKNPN